ncbi:MAG: asparagine synthase-related protein [Nitrospinota bacterium]
MKSFFNEGLSDATDGFFSHRPRWLTTSKSKLFFSTDLKERLNGASPENSLMSTIPARFDEWAPIARAQYLETKNLLPGYILSSQGDRVSMAHSLEGRVPFLHHRVVEFCARLPLHYKIRGLNEKYILKKCVKRYLPKRIVKRTKQPYMAPDSKSFFHGFFHGGKGMDYVEELLSEERISEYGYFNPKPVKLLENKCRKGNIVGFKDNMAVVGILSTQLLHKRFVEDFPNNIEKVENVRDVNQPVA